MVQLRDKMRNDVVRLEPLNADHEARLEAIGAREAIWSYLPYRGGRSDFSSYFSDFLQEHDQNQSDSFCILSADGSEVIGTVAFINQSKLHRHLEIGHLWVHPEHQGGKVFPAVMHLMIGRAFDWGALRVELRCQTGNTKALIALTRLGATREGSLRSHLRMVDGTRQDTLIFSILNNEWPKIEQKLSQRLNS